MIHPTSEVKWLLFLVHVLCIQVLAQSLLRESATRTTQKGIRHTLNTEFGFRFMLSYASMRFLRKLIAAAVQWELLWLTGISMTSFEKISI